MTSDFQANVVLEVELPERLAAGATIDVTCKAEPDRRTGGYFGEWTIQVVLPSGHRRQLVTQRRPGEARIIRTLTGVASMLTDAGCDTVNVPFRKGGTASNGIETTASG